MAEELIEELQKEDSDITKEQAVEHIGEIQSLSDKEKAEIDFASDIRDARFRLEEVQTRYYSSLSMMGLTFILVGLTIQQIFELNYILYLSAISSIAGSTLVIYSLYKLIAVKNRYEDRAEAFIENGRIIGSRIMEDRKHLKDLIEEFELE